MAHLACSARPIWRARIPRFILTRARIWKGWKSFSNNSLFPAILALTLPLKHPAPFTRVANWGTAFRMPTALAWTIQTLSLHAWWEMARPKPDHLRPLGTPINSLILSVMGRYYRY